jgi:hypothetical protein
LFRSGGAEARRHRPGRGLNTPTDTPSPQGSSRSTPMLRTSQRRGLGRNQEVQFSLLNDQRDVDKDVLFEYDAYVRKRLSTAVPTTVPSSLLHASSKSSNMRDSRSCLGLGTTTRTEPPVPFLSDGKANTCVQEDANDRNEDTILFERSVHVPHLQRYCAEPGLHTCVCVCVCVCTRARVCACLLTLAFSCARACQ